jgi:thymidylate synthase
MEPYLTLLDDVLTKGKKRSSTRTGTTYSLFGYQNRYPLQPTFPAVTTKKLYWNGVVTELLWFLRGDTNVKYLHDHNVHIWNEWQDEDGYLGPVYGHQWTRWQQTKIVAENNYPHHNLVKQEELACGYGYPGNPDKNDPYYWKLQSIWGGILHRCYNEKRKDYAWYGAKGVHMDPAWHSFEQFQKDVKQIPGWNSFIANPWLYSLDKDFHAANRYGPDTCVWSLPVQQRLNTGRHVLVLATHEDGRRETVVNIPQFAKDRNYDVSTIYSCVRGERKGYKGWKFEKVNLPPQHYARVRIINQIHEVIGSIKTRPESRRHLVTTWNPGELENMRLEPCHDLFQFHVDTEDNTLSCQLYQRSGDAFLGVPFNVASYSLLTCMIAQVCDLKPGEFIHTFGDIHIYENHLDQVKIQLSRQPLPAPTLWLDPSVKNIDDFRHEHILLKDYQSHPAIKAPVAV